MSVHAANRRGVLLVGAWLLAAAVAAPASAADKIALVVGVDDYLVDELPSLDYAREDAARLGAALERLGFEVTVMSSKASGKRFRPETPDAILREAQALFAERNADDAVVFAFSGHGGRLVGGNNKPESDYLFPANSRLSDKTTLLPLEQIVSLAARCGSQRKLILIDSSRDSIRVASDAQRGDGEARPQLDNNPPKRGVTIELDPARVAQRPPVVALVPHKAPPGTTVFMGSQPGERSYEARDIGGSVFTRNVIRFLNGDGPPEAYPRGEASVAGLVPFVREATAAYLEKRLAVSQTPQAILPTDEIPGWTLGKPVP